MLKNTTIVRIPSVKAPLITTFSNDHPDLVTKLEEYEVKYVVGEIDEAAFTQFLNDEYFPAAEAMEQDYIQWMEAYEAQN